MRIKEITYQNRRDFKATFICPFCGHEENHCGYDDNNFHKNVIPEMECEKCGKTEKDGESYRPLATKYPEDYEI